VLECVILKDIQPHAEMAAENERKLVDRLLAFSGQEQEHGKSRAGKDPARRNKPRFVYRGCQ